MEASDAAEHVAEAGESAADDKFRSRVALIIAFMAMLLAITSLGGGNAPRTSEQKSGSNTWAFYQEEHPTDRLPLARTTPNSAPGRRTLRKRARVCPQGERVPRDRERYENEPDQKDP